MNIETANRLYEYRKRMGYSQEELAEKIGVSRQAVSKWERAEASPDTDNLIALSRIYGVTLDEMLTGSKPADSANAEQPAQEEPQTQSDPQTEEAPKTDHVHIGWDGIHIHDKNGDRVDIDRHGVFVSENGEQKVYTDADGHIHKSADVIEKEQEHHHSNFWMKLPYPILTVIAYILFGTLNVMGGWAYGWIVFLTIPLYYTFVEAVIKRRLAIFCYPVLVAAAYLIIGFALDLWHPGWVIFLTIPVYYWIAGAVEKERNHDE